MDQYRVPRRTAPSWVQEATSPALHGIAGRFLRLRAVEGLSERQEWLWDQVIGDLEWRYFDELRPLLRCSCSLCTPPDPF